MEKGVFLYALRKSDPGNKLNFYNSLRPFKIHLTCKMIKKILKWGFLTFSTKFWNIGGVTISKNNPTPKAMPVNTINFVLFILLAIKFVKNRNYQYSEIYCLIFFRYFQVHFLLSFCSISLIILVEIYIKLIYFFVWVRV